VTSSSRSTRVGLGIALPTLVLALAGRGWAQTPGGSTGGTHPTRLEGPVTLLLLLAVGLLLLLGLIGKVLDLRLKRDGEVIAVKGVISDALGGDPELFELPLTATVRVPLWSGSPVTIRVFGEVPSSELKRAALLRVERAATTELSVRARIKSRIGVVPNASKPPLRRARSG
jgi:hypothetical protein